MAKTRAIRFSDKEELQIEEFLRNNPFFDFSTIARLSILAFIKDPKVEIRPNKTSERTSVQRGEHGQPRN